jgi:glycosyltransferase involved in cell wall biosynthesis
MPESYHRGVTIFIPVFNEESILEAHTKKLIIHLQTFGFPYEIIIGSNGSFDKTVMILEALKKGIPCLNYFHIPIKAVGRAFRIGLESARFNRVISLDMDLSIDLSFIERAYHQLETSHVVVGSKITGDQQRSVLRKTASNAFIFCARTLLGLSFSDYSIAAKAYRKDTITTYLPHMDDKTFYVTEILFRASRDGKTLTEIPVDCNDTRPSRFNLIHEGWYKFSRLFVLYFAEKHRKKKKLMQSSGAGSKPVP